MVWTIKENDLLTAIKKGSISEINQAIQNGANVNATDDCGWTPLTYACTYKASKEVIELLKKAEKAQFTALKANLAKLEQENANLKQKIDEQNAQIAYNNFQAKKIEQQRMTNLMLGKYRHK